MLLFQNNNISYIRENHRRSQAHHDRITEEEVMAYIDVSISCILSSAYNRRDCMVVGFTTTRCLCNQCLSPLMLESHSWHGVLVAGWWFSLGTAASSTNKTDYHDITQILLKIVLNTITLTL